jgi:hypothetical protein
MKISKLFTIDEENARELKKEENASKLINDLLSDHFGISGTTDLIEKQQEKIEEETNKLNEFLAKKSEKDGKKAERYAKFLEMKKVLEFLNIIKRKKERKEDYKNLISIHAKALRDLWFIEITEEEYKEMAEGAI